MELSAFGERFSARTGIQELMDDLGAAAAGGEKLAMLGGGNPAQIPEVSQVFRRRMEEILASGDELDRMLGTYDAPGGKQGFLEAVAELLRREFDWPVTARNIVVTSGSQNAAFIILNMFSGTTRDGRKRKILFPLVPEYIGYADQAVDADSFVAQRPVIRELGGNSYKYFIDFDRLEIEADIGAICVSRPTNPTGNVLTDDEVRRLSEAAEHRGIPLFIDNAYGSPFPHIIFKEVRPFWNENTIIGMSLSKIGLPTVRTGILVAREEIISAVASANAVMNLAIGGIGQALLDPLVRSGEILRLSNDVVRPYYSAKSAQAQRWFRDAFGNSVDYAIHSCEGSIFLWIWFKSLPITTLELYRRLKARRVLVIPGQYFFFGLEAPWRHQDECIRVSYAQNDEDVRRGIEIIADEVRKLS
ncbi:MAG TPA: valine--pyruvate transaminase [Spirochaetia bacterium]|nr:valine--pyruvate transaminase [Spirochaetia bacterium]